jgi:hypothetical protein
MYPVLRQFRGAVTGEQVGMAFAVLALLNLVH